MSDQWRYQRTRAGEYASPLGRGDLRDMHLADTYALAARLGWVPVLPELRPQPARPRRRGRGRGAAGRRATSSRELAEGRLRFAAEDPDGPGNFPKVLTLWRANLLGSSSKGHEYFLRHVLGVEDAADPQRRGAARPALEGRRLARRGAHAASSTSSRRSTSA